METLSTTCLIIFVLSIIGTLICCFTDASVSLFNIFIAVTAISGLIGIFSSLFVSEKPKEFPASKYELEYRVDIHPTYNDTTYVLIPIK